MRVQVCCQYIVEAPLTTNTLLWEFLVQTKAYGVILLTKATTKMTSFWLRRKQVHSFAYV